MANSDEKPICFVIAPIGHEGSDTRERADKVLKYVIAPAVETCGYKALRADDISLPGMITSQIITHLVEDALVVADLTEHNPNVFYELAVRHAAKKPVIHIIEASQSIPFDVGNMRAIFLDYRDLGSAEECRQAMVRQIRAAERDPSESENPISQTIDFQSLRGSGNPLKKSMADMLSTVQEVRVMLADLANSIAVPRRLEATAIRSLQNTLARLDACLTLKPGKRPTKRQFREAQSLLAEARTLTAVSSPIPALSDLMAKLLVGETTPFRFQDFLHTSGHKVGEPWDS